MIPVGLMFTGAGAPRGSYAKSIDISLPSDWSSVIVTGQWAFSVPDLGEMLMSVMNADALVFTADALSVVKTWLGENE